VVSGLVDCVSGTLDPKVFHGYSLPHSQRKSRARLHPRQKSGVSAAQEGL
jgi:hypothetical protein